MTQERISGGRPRDPIEAYLEALREGAPVDEASRLLAQVFRLEAAGEISSEDIERVLVEGHEIAPDISRSAMTQASIETDRISQGTPPFLGMANLGKVGEIGKVGQGIGSALGRAATSPGRAGAAEVLSRTTAEGQKILTEAGSRALLDKPGLAQSVLQWIGSHKKTTAALTLGGGLAAAVSAIPEIEGAAEGQQGGPGGTGVGVSAAGVRGLAGGAGGLPQDLHQGTQTPEVLSPGTQVDPGFNVMVVDRDGSLTGVPGQVAIIPPEQLGTQTGLSPGLLQDLATTQTFGTSGPGGNVGGVDLLNNGVVAAGIGGLQVDNRIKQIISPISMGQVTVSGPVQVRPPRPSGVEVARGVRQGTPESIGADAKGPTPIGNTGFVDTPGGPVRVEPDPVDVPGGASIAPRIFQETRGRSLLEWASIAAQRHGVPLNILYGIIDHESNWNPNAVGDNGNSHGLAQIYQPTWGSQISPSQSKDPVFALEWTAKMLSQRFKQYGRWDAAIAAHNSPVAADHLARNNRFLTEKSASYVGSVMSRSNTSGIDNYVFAEDALMGIEIEGSGGGGGGRTYTPFQNPDPAASREYVESTYKELLGRSPTEEEYEKEVARISQLAKQQYDANLTQAKGGTSQGVDPESQFRQGIKDTGEFAFTEDTHELDSFTDYAAGVSRLLQQGL